MFRRMAIARLCDNGVYIPALEPFAIELRARTRQTCDAEDMSRKKISEDLIMLTSKYPLLVSLRSYELQCPKDQANANVSRVCVDLCSRYMSLQETILESSASNFLQPII